MTKPNAPRSRPYRLSDGGRAKTCQVSLSPPQAAWLASQGIPASAVLRMLVDDAMAGAGYMTGPYDQAKYVLP